MKWFERWDIVVELMKLVFVKKIVNGDFLEVLWILKKVSGFCWCFYLKFEFYDIV